MALWRALEFPLEPPKERQLGVAGRGPGEVVLHNHFRSHLAIGTVHDILHEAVLAAREVNAREDLSAVRVGAHDEIFQCSKPVLTGVDVFSLYCYLLSLEDHRDADTWGVRLLELEAKGLHPERTIADFAGGLRAGQAAAWPPTWRTVPWVS